MRRPFAFAAGLMALLSSAVGQAGLTEGQRLSDAQTLLGLIAHRYAPLTWKEEHLGLFFETMAGELLASVEGEMTDEEYFAAMTTFVASLEDAHASLRIPSMQTARLGFSVDYVDGEVVIDSVDRRALPIQQFPFDRGDALVSIDGVPALQMIEAFEPYRGIGYDPAEKRYFAAWLTDRAQVLLPFMPGPRAWVVIRSRRDGALTKLSLPWIIEGYGLARVSGESQGLEKGGEEEILPVDGEGDPLERMRHLVADDIAAMAASGQSKPFFPLPKDFEEIRGAPLFAGTFPLEEKRIGFLRIPTWIPSNQQAIVGFLAKQIPIFEADTSALLIDQTNNGGGSLCYLEAVTSMFLREAIPKMLFRIRANRTWLLIFEQVLQSLPPSHEAVPAVREIVFALRNAMAHGQALTDPFPLCSPGETLEPFRGEGRSAVAYTKPILILINELDASAADVFPAVMQDGGRATLLGTRTMGAGGNVVGVGPMGHSDFFVRITESLMWRAREVPDGAGGATHYIENVGVSPDIPYEITLDDFLNGYQGYWTAIETSLKEMVGQP